MTDFPDLKLKALLSYPANIIGGVGLTATKANGSLTLDYAWQEFGAISAIPTSPTSYILTYDTVTNAYVMVPSHLLGGAVAGIADANMDGIQYGRQSGQWTPVIGVLQTIYIAVADASAATIDPNVKRLSTQFFDATTKVGGAHYIRVSLIALSGVQTQAYFRSIDRYMPDGTTDATNGGYWLLDESVVDWRMMGVRADGSDDTVAAQAAIDFCKSNSRTLKMAGTVSVSKITINQFALVESDSCTLVANSSAAQTCLLEIKGIGVLQGMLVASVGYKTNYQCAFWIWNENSLQYASLQNMTANGALIGFRFGNVAYPGAVISESSLVGATSYGCPVVFEVVGWNTYLTIGYPQAPADAFGGNTSWQALEQIGLRTIGANVTMIGGEILASTTGPLGALFVIRPIESNPGLGEWGALTINSVECETGIPYLLRTENPAGLTINPEYRNRGKIEITSCTGYHNSDTEPFIYLDPTYNGTLIVHRPDFWCLSNRTQPNIYCDVGSTVDIYQTGDFGPGFLAGMTGVVGGILHFPTTEILRASGLGGAYIATAGFQACAFTNAEGGPDKTHFSGNYNAGTGEFTLPYDLQDVVVTISIRMASPVSGSIILSDTGTEVCRTYGANGCFNMSHSVGVEYAGHKLAVAVDVDANSLPDGSSFRNVFSIRARN